MEESYGTYVDDEYFDNHDYDDTDDDTDDDNDHKKDSNTAAGAAPTETRPDHARPGWAKSDPKNTLWLACFGMNGLQIGPGKLLYFHYEGFFDFYRSRWVPGPIYWL